MSPAVLRRVLAPLSLALVVGGLAAAPSQGVQVRHVRLGGVGVPVARSVTPGYATAVWRGVPGATRYRLVWSGRPYGRFLEQRGPWLSASARRASVRVPAGYSTGLGQRAAQVALPYGNAVYVKLQVSNGHSTRQSRWSNAVFPRISTPRAGNRLRLGTWNLGGSHNAAAVVRSVRAARLDVLTLQEADNAVTTDLSHQLGWDGSRPLHAVQQGILWNPARWTEEDFRVVSVPNYKKPGTSLSVPVVRLVPTAAGSNRRAIWVASPHFATVPTASIVTKNAQSSAAARVLLAGLARFTGADPVVAAGDLFSNREPYVVPTANNPGGGQQTLVQHGWWDTRAALRRYGTAYSTFNRGSYPQQLSPVGVSSRADYIMTKGIHGATTYSNVGNQRSPISDHNLVWSEVLVPSS